MQRISSTGQSTSMTCAGTIPISTSGTPTMVLGRLASRHGMPQVSCIETKEKIYPTPRQPLRTCGFNSFRWPDSLIVISFVSTADLECSLSCQMTESYDSAWYGTFKLSPDEPYPTPDSDLYPPSIYVSFRLRLHAMFEIDKLISSPGRIHMTPIGGNSLARSLSRLSKSFPTCLGIVSYRASKTA